MLSAVKGFFLANKLLAGLGGIALLIGALIWLRHDAYKDGVADRDAEIVAANLELERQLNEAEDIADEIVIKKNIEYAEKLTIELDKIDETKDNGSSPFDVLFPVGVQ